MDIVVGMLGNPASLDGVVAVHNADQKEDTDNEDLHMPSVSPPGAPNCDVHHAGQRRAPGRRLPLRARAGRLRPFPRPAEHAEVVLRA